MICRFTLIGKSEFVDEMAAKEKVDRSTLVNLLLKKYKEIIELAS